MMRFSWQCSRCRSWTTPNLSLRHMSGGPKPKKKWAKWSRNTLSSRVAMQTTDARNAVGFSVAGLNRQTANISPRHQGRNRPDARTRHTDRKRRDTDDFTAQGLGRRTENVPPPIQYRTPADAKTTDGDRKSEGKEKAKPLREMKHMKMHQALAGVSRTTRTVAREHIQSLGSFDDFKLLPSVKEAILSEALAGLTNVRPTAVQKLVIPALTSQKPRQRGKNPVSPDAFLIAAETGSGKTLAYTIPLLDSIKRQDLDENEAARKAKLLSPPSRDDLEIPVVESDGLDGRPRAVILVPTAELVKQVGNLIKTFAHVVKLRVVSISRDLSPTVIRNKFLRAPVDVVICTPHLLNSLTEVNPALFSRCTHVVVDEADSLFDRSFSLITTALVNRCKNLEKLILCSATIPRSLDTRLRTLYPKLERLVTPNLHVVPRRVQLRVVDCQRELYRGNKKLACADVLYTIAKDSAESGFITLVIVFVNERETVVELAEYLRTTGIDAIEFSRDSANRVNAEVLEIFTGQKMEAAAGLVGKQRLKVMVTTDIASRGVDTKAVKHVVLYDKPHSAIDMIHRIGRAGRMGRRGGAVILADKYINRGWVKDIKTSMHMGGPLV